MIYTGYGCVDCVEAGGLPAGAVCGSYIVGKTVKLLKELNAFYKYDGIIFDVLGDECAEASPLHSRMQGY